MNISLNWIKKYIDFPKELTPEQIAYDLTMRTVEVENISHTIEKFNNITVGKIIEVKNHPNADLLRICMVDIGDEIKQIVCGGSNLYENELVAVALPGAVVKWHGEGEPVIIKETKMRGEKSFGMICASEEIYLGDIFKAKNEKEILDITDFDVKVGDNVGNALGFDDVILEVDNKSLTNRPDLWGHYGIARELSAIYDLQLKKMPELNIPQNISDYKITIKEPDKCYRYAGVEIDNVYTKESPLWMKVNLLNAGLRPINAIVDITNYVLLAIGQPTHAFDETHISGKEIVVRNAKEGETLELLDENNIKLTAEDLVIADAESPLALAGIRGGKKDSILSDTKKVFLEVATFSASSIRKTGNRFSEKTDSSIRYEKGIDTDRVDIGLALSINLFGDIFPDCKIISFHDECPNPTKSNHIQVFKEFLDERLGVELDNGEINHILKKLEYKVNFDGESYHIEVPTFRSTGDVGIKDDILGEIARIKGYENFEKTDLTIHFDKAINQPKESLDRKIREFIALRGGFYEIYTYPWSDDKYLNAVKTDKNECIKLSTPPSPDLSCLRNSLIPNLLESVNKNLRYYEDFKIFESGSVFTKGEYKPSSEAEVLPMQPHLIAGAAVGTNPEDVFFTVKGLIERLPAYCHIEPITLEQKSRPVWADKNVYLNIISSGEIIGDIGLASITTMKNANIKRKNIAIFEFCLDKLKVKLSRDNQFVHLPEFPLVTQDLSLLVDESLKWDDIKNTIGNMVKKLEFVEEYRGKQIPEGKKSITLTVIIGNNDSTMTAKQIEKKMNNIINILSKKLGVAVREQ